MISKVYISTPGASGGDQSGDPFGSASLIKWTGQIESSREFCAYFLIVVRFPIRAKIKG